MSFRPTLVMAVILALGSLQVSQPVYAFTAEECQIKHEILVNRIAGIQAFIQQAFASNARNRFVIQKLRNQQITQLKGEYMSQCAEFIP